MDNPYIAGSDVLAQAQAVLSNLYGANWGGAVEALNNPQQLSPEERRKISDRLGLTGTPLAPLVDITANPAVLIGLGLTLRYPVPTLEKLQGFKGELGKVKPDVLPFSQLITNFHHAYRDTPLPSSFEYFSHRKAGILEQPYRHLTESLNAYRGARGADAKKEVIQKVLATVDDSLNPTAPQWGVLSSALGQHVDGEWQSPLGLSQEAATRIRAKIATLANPTLDGPEVELAGNLQNYWRRLWGQLPKDKESLHQIADGMSHFVGASDLAALKARIETDPENAFKSIERYWPRLSDIPFEERQAMEAARVQRQYSTRSEQQEIDAAEQLVGRSTSRNFAERSGATILSPAYAKELGVDGEIVDALQRAKEAGLNTYHPDLDDTLSVGDKFAKTVALYSKRTGGPSIHEEVQQVLSHLETQGAHGRLLKRNLVSAYLPQMLGNYTPRQATQMIAFASAKEGLAQALGPETAIGKAIPRAATAVREWLTKSPSSSLPILSQSMANWLNLGALGGNVVAPAVNMLQLITTAVPTLGFGNVVKGINRTVRGAATYAAARQGGGLTPQDAFAKAFPEFHSVHTEIDSTARQAVEDAVETAFRSNRFGGAITTVMQKVRNAGLFLFHGSETANRLITFYAAKHYAEERLPGQTFYDPARAATVEVTKDNLGWASNWLAKRLVGETQYGPGPLFKPGIFKDANPLISQYSTYPANTAVFGAKALTRAGTLGRLLLGAGLVYGIGKEIFHSDPSRGLIFGAAGSVNKSGIPLISPAVQIGADTLKATFTGDTHDLSGDLPLLAPGGIAVAQRVGAIPGLGWAAVSANRSYADYSNPTPDGRYPVYSAEGVLRGYYSKPALVAKAVLGTDPSAQQEAATYQFLTSNADRIREMKRQALQALNEGDYASFADISHQYEQAYPRQGGLPIRRSDIRALHLRNDITRVERALEGLPPELRPTFAAATAAGIGSNVDEFLGLLDSGLLSAHTINEREPYRARQASETEQRVNDSLHGKKVSDVLGGSANSPDFRLGGTPTPHPVFGNYFGGFEGGQ